MVAPLKSVTNAKTTIRRCETRSANQCYRRLPIKTHVNGYTIKFVIKPDDTINSKICLAVIIFLILIFPKTEMHTRPNKPCKTFNFIERIKIELVQTAHSETLVPCGYLRFDVI